MSNVKKVQTTSTDILLERLAALQQLIPEAFSEGRIDYARLQAALGEFVDDSPERYSFTWAGKRDAIRLLQMPTRATLIPCPEESVDWENTRNLFIEGDNLEALKLLLKPYYGRVKLIYIDPPYNTGNDFIYPDNYADPLATYLQLTGQKDSEGNLLTSNPETGGRYHSAWLSMMYPRLFLARQLLREDGAIFLSIDDHEVHNLRLMMNEIFGEENFLCIIIVQSNKRGQTYKTISKTHEYILVYLKNTAFSDIGEIEKSGERDDLNLEDEIGRFTYRELRNRNPKYGRHNRPNLFYPIYINPNIIDANGFSPISLHQDSSFCTKLEPLNRNGEESCWRWGKQKIQSNIGASTQNSNVVARKKTTGEYGIYEKYRKTTYKAKTIWYENDVITEKGTIELGELGLADSFAFPKPISLIKKILTLATDDDEIVVDFFAGSATTAHSVLELNIEDSSNRQFIMVQLPEPTGNPQYPTIAEIGKERIRRVIARLQDERQGQPEDLGFKVFKLAESNWRAWSGVEQANGKSYASQMELFSDPLVEGWLAENVLAETALKEAGFGLNYQVEHLPKVRKQQVMRVSDPEKEQSFYICLDERIALEALKPLELKADDLFICRASALDDSTAANLELQCRLRVI
ncbi:MAG: site-specific DNA-methyltransferase [Anaerolineales bacterium]|nr:site-specific DNA-methyltransferase [Anaerolineales bacterium]